MIKTVRDVIRRSPVWLNPDHSVESAIVLMRGHRIGSLPVVGGDAVVGIVLLRDLVGVDPSRPVEEVMSTSVPELSPEMSVREAAEILTDAPIRHAAVLCHGRLIGVITDSDLLPELGRSYDPLTQLPWTDTLREWAIERLKRGDEITVLFIDLDRFGQFNKVYGHIVGDEVLQSAAQAMEAMTDPAEEMLCRYGGDEFCLVSLRSAEEATQLGERLARRVSELRIPAMGDEHITCSVGQSGGKRGKEREHTHFAATLNNLINLASRDCTRNKQQRAAEGLIAPAADSTGAASPRLRLAKIEVNRLGATTRVQVDLQLGPEAPALPGSPPLPEGPRPAFLDGVNRFSASVTTEVEEEAVLRLVAETTATALRSFLPAGCDITLSEVIVHEMAAGQALVTTVGQFSNGTRTNPIAGSVIVGEDPYRAAATSVLSAVNRSLTLLFEQSQPRA